jgi:hypothetical protein
MEDLMFSAIPRRGDVRSTFEENANGACQNEALD